MKIKARKVENGFIVSYGKKEFFCKDEDEGRIICNFSIPAKQGIRKVAVLK